MTPHTKNNPPARHRRILEIKSRRPLSILGSLSAHPTRNCRASTEIRVLPISRVDIHRHDAHTRSLLSSKVLTAHCARDPRHIALAPPTHTSHSAHPQHVSESHRFSERVGPSGCSSQGAFTRSTAADAGPVSEAHTRTPLSLSFQAAIRTPLRPSPHLSLLMRLARAATSAPPLCARSPQKAWDEPREGCGTCAHHPRSPPPRRLFLCTPQPTPARSVCAPRRAAMRNRDAKSPCESCCSGDTIGRRRRRRHQLRHTR